MYKLFLTLRYLTRKWIVIFAVLSVWMCVAMVLIVFSVMDGFLDNIKEHSRGLLSDIVVDNASLQGFPYYDEFSKYLMDKSGDEVKVVTPVIYNYGIMREPDTNFTKPVRVVAIKLNDYCRVNTFRDSLYYDKYYPGTTTLGPFEVPLAAIPGGRPVLPPEYEKLFADYVAKHPKDESLKELKPSPFSPDGVGRFVQTFDETPGYADAEALPGIIIGTDVVYTRNADGSYNRRLFRGCKVILTILPLTIKGTIAEDPVSLVMRHVDDSRTRVYEIDSMCVYIDFDLAQKMLSMGPQERVDGTKTPPRTSQLLVQLADGVDIKEARARVQDLWNEFLGTVADRASPEDLNLLRLVTIETWEERQIQFIAAVEKEKVLVTLLFVIISFVAVLLISVIFYMVVLQKTRDIGIIKSLGATRGGVAAIFLMYGAAVGVVGGILGVLTGTVFVHYINQIQDLLAQLHPNLRVWSPDVYTFDRIPNVVKTHVIGAVFLAAVVTSTAGAVVPAIKAALVWPIQSLRYE